MEQILLGFQEEILILSVWLVEREDLQVWNVTMEPEELG